MSRHDSAYRAPFQPFQSAPPWIERPAGGHPFLMNGAVQLPAIGATVIICAKHLRPDRSAVIKAVANEFVGFGWSSGDGNLKWQIYRNGACVENFENILVQLGLTAQPRYIDPLRFRGGDIIQLACTNVGVAAAGQSLIGALGGYDYPRDLDPPNVW